MAMEELKAGEEVEWGPLAWAFLLKVRQQSPLIQCITNFVSMDLMANTLLFAGASPAMLHSVEELPEFTPNVHALCVNLGTLTPDWLPAMKVAAELAVKSCKPWVLDPVAAGASTFRLKACAELVELKPTVIRGNGSESLRYPLRPLDLPRCCRSRENLGSFKSGAVVAVSGAVDIITDGVRVVGAHNGVPMMQKITATGCSVTALIAAFVAADPSRAFEATAIALSIFGVAGEMGMAIAKGPASLQMQLIDSLHAMDEPSLLSQVKIGNLH